MFNFFKMEPEVVVEKVDEEVVVNAFGEEVVTQTFEEVFGMPLTEVAPEADSVNVSGGAAPVLDVARDISA